MPPIPRPKLVAPGEDRSLRLFGVRFDYKVTSDDSGGSLAVLEIEIPPKILVKPHNHTREDEFTQVLAGTVGVRAGDQVLEATTGASLVKPRGIPHAMWNASTEPARVLEILSPGGLEAYFEELAPVLAKHAPRRLLPAGRPIRPHHHGRLDRGAGAHLRRQALAAQKRAPHQHP
jgi:quercetin dioxygenase-like cupin family protein